jgi:hypothetical protein
MYCPEHLILKKGPLSIWMYWFDVPRENIPLRVWLNLLRYEVIVHVAPNRIWPTRPTVVVINRAGLWATKWANTIYRLQARFGLKPPIR